MEIQLTLHGHTRKEAADCIGSAIGVAPVYLAAPSFNYDIGGIILNRQGVLTIGDCDEGLPNVLRNLQAAGFYTPESTEPASDSPPEEAPGCLTIQIPFDGFSPEKLDNLRKLVASKATLIQKVTAAEKLPIVENGETLDFPWFIFDATSEEVNAYTQFISRLCDMAKKQQRVLATDKTIENEKYAFRVFLLRLGFIGEEHAASRRILLRNLSGNGSHRRGNGKPQTEINRTSLIRNQYPLKSDASSTSNMHFRSSTN